MLFRRSSCDYLIVGLGNPGAQYEKTRHNVGFRALDALAREAGAKPDRAKFQALTCLCDVGGLRALLLKPQTFMNNSGLAVRQAADYYKLPPERVLVLFDDVDLDVGRLHGQSGLSPHQNRGWCQTAPRLRPGRLGALPLFGQRAGAAGPGH